MLPENILNQCKESKEFLLFKNATDYSIIDWGNVAGYFLPDKISNVELIGPENRKIPIPKNGIHQDRRFILDKIKENHSFIITQFYSTKQKLYDEAKNILDFYKCKSVDFHLYGGLNENSYTFGAHSDLASNYIVQLDGKSEWTLYNETESTDNLLNYDNRPESELSVKEKIILNPGDILYIPSGKYHKCVPLDKRISLSIQVL